MLRYMTDRARPGLVTLYDIRPGNGAGQFLQPQSLYSYEASKKQLDISQLEQGTWNVLTFSKVSLIASIIKIAYATLTSTIF